MMKIEIDCTNLIKMMDNHCDWLAFHSELDHFFIPSLLWNQTQINNYSFILNDIDL